MIGGSKNETLRTMHQEELLRICLGALPRLLSTAALLLAVLISGPLACAPGHRAEEPAPTAPEDLRRWSELSKSGRDHLLFRRYERAEEAFGAALELSRAYRPSDVRRRSSLGNLQQLARAYLGEGLPQDFARVMLLVMESCRDVPAAQNDALTENLLLLGRLQRSDGQLEVSREALELTLSIQIRTAGERDVGVAHTRRELGLTLIDSGDLDRAEQEIMEASGIVEASVGSGHPAFADALSAMARLREAQQRGDEAEVALQRAVEINRGAAGPAHRTTVNAMGELVRFYQRNDRANDVETTLEEMVAAQREKNAQSLLYIQALNELAWFYLKSQRPAEAESPARTALEILESGKAGNPVKAAVFDTLATSLRQQGQYPESEKFYLQAIETSRASANKGDLEAIANRYSELLRHQGREAEAEHLLETLHNPSSGSDEDGNQAGVDPGSVEAE
jgi:tetratricopeptide (TPR) repeat protein